MSAARARVPNKGIARRPPEFLGWEVGVEGPYVAIPGCGGEWEWEWECGARAVTKNKGFARRPQEFLAWEVGGRM